MTSCPDYCLDYVLPAWKHIVSRHLVDLPLEHANHKVTQCIAGGHMPTGDSMRVLTCDDLPMLAEGAV